MGLDMYLTAKRWASKYTDEDFAKAITDAVGDDAPPPAGNLDSVEIGMEVAYWRKANAIHAWFVREVQEGNDDCGEHFVQDGTLERLRDICRDLLQDQDPVKAEALLPTQSGFFFGSTGYDEWYWGTIKTTEEKLTQLLKWREGRGSRWHFYYSSSW